MTGFSSLSMPWDDMTYEAFVEGCEACERRVMVEDVNLFDRVKSVLQKDYSKNGARGIALSSDIPELGLRRGDRLEPSLENPCLESLLNSEFKPGNLVFWRRSEETTCRRRNPLWNSELGITPQLFILID